MTKKQVIEKMIQEFEIAEMYYGSNEAANKAYEFEHALRQLTKNEARRVHDDKKTKGNAKADGYVFPLGME